MRGLLVLLLALLVAAPTSPARAQEPARLALVIGNQAYGPKVGALINPHNDIARVGGALTSVGFKVTPHRDARRTEILRAVRAHANALARAGPKAIGFLYYSGHGVARPDTRANYLIPVDVADTASDDFWDDAVALDDVLKELEQVAPNAAHFVVFDACRNEIRLTAKGAAKGFVPVAERSGMFIAFATALGQPASDAGSGPYAAALAAEIIKRGQHHLDLFQNVKETVLRSTGQRQEPWERSGLRQRIFLAGEAPAAAPPAASPSASDAVRVCREVEAMSSLTVLAVLERQHKGTPAGECVSARIAEITAAQGAAKKAEEEARAKAEAERRQVALLRQQEAERKKVEEEARGRAESEARKREEAEAAARKRAEDEARRRAPDPALTVTPGSGKSFRDNLADGKPCAFCPEMVVVPAGQFAMGSPASEPEREGWQKGVESPQREVRIGRPFALGKFEVTRGQFAAFARETGHHSYGCRVFTGSEWETQADRSWQSVGFSQTDNHPVVCVNWDDAKAYVAWLSRKLRKAYRLLSSAEWEYAARARTTTPFWWGAQITPAQANYNGNYVYKGGGAKGEYRERSVPVDSFAPNPWGLYNVHGNVSEWVEDCFFDSYSGGPTDGSARTTECTDSSRRVFRGGSWQNTPAELRSASRYGAPFDVRLRYVGFRVGRTLTP